MAAAHRASAPTGQVRRVSVMAVLAVAAVAGGGAWASGMLPGSSQRVAAQPIVQTPSQSVQARPALASAPSPWRTGWALSLDHPGVLAGTDLTCRLVARTALSGNRVRFRLINYPSTTPVSFTHLVAAVRTSGMSVDAATEREVTVHGSSAVTLPANGQVYTDPVTLPVARGEDVTLSISVGSGVSAPWHYWSSQASGCTPPGAGDTAAAADGAAFSQRSEDRWLSEVQVVPTTTLPTFAAYGDSLTDGLYLPVDTQARWTDQVQALTGDRLVGLNFGVAGDRITGQAPGGQLPPRVATDVMAPRGVSAVVVEMGSNDIKAGMTALDILSEYRLMDALISKAGETMIVVTVPPRGDGLTAAQEHERELLNFGLRAYPIVADIDGALTDPATGFLRGSYDAGDHIHPNVSGESVMTQVMLAALAKLPGPVGVAAR